MAGQRRHRQPSASYQIRVRGHLGPRTLRAFAALHRAAARAGHARREPAKSALGTPAHGAGTVGEDDLLLADAQTSGGLLVAGELPGATVIGELVRRRDSVLIIR